MSSTMKISLLALISTVAAVPHYGANPHSKFHGAKSSVAAGYGTGSGNHGTGKPYPTGGWSGEYNSTAIPYPTGTGAHGDDKTTTKEGSSTATETLYSTVYAKSSSGAGNYEASGVVAEKALTGANDKCGPATITVTATASDKVTVTVGGGADHTPAPNSSAAPVESKPDNGYGAPSSGSTKVVPETSAAQKPSSAPAAEKPTTAPAAEYPAETPKAKASTTAAAESSKAEEPTSSKAEGYAVPSLAHKQAQTVKSSAAPSATSTASTGSYSGSKRGLAYNEASLCSSFGKNYGFGYNWGQTESTDIGAQFAPMHRVPGDTTADVWMANVETAYKKGSRVVMGFNECDQAGQCNMSPDAACTEWKKYMNPVKAKYSDVTIVGPSVTNGQEASKGLNWLSSFKSACPDAQIDATNIHFYHDYSEKIVDQLKTQVEKAAQLYGKPVWLTEFGINPGKATEEQAASFLKEAVAYLDGCAEVAGYAYFMVGTGENQLNSGSGLSAVGKVYAGN